MSIFSPKIKLLDTSTKLSKEEGIAALIMLGWELVLPNLLLKPKSFKLSASIGIMNNGNFIFVEDKTGTISSMDTITYKFEDENFLLIYTPNTMVRVILDNTNE